ncbi:MAG TPA: phage tail protein [Candidatus Binatia bacterium]|nr:phage tail protein [Candidatus Binatia bacterium]
MGSPILPSDFEEAISSPTATICGNFVNTLLRLPTMIYQFFNWMLTPGGNVSNAFKQEIIPSGFVMASAHSTVPEGWLLCNGQEVLRADYPELFTAIGILYGAGNGTTTFLVPDYRARFLCGAGTFTGSVETSHETAVLGTPGGEDKVQLQPDEYGRNHVHVIGRFEGDSGDHADNLYVPVTDNDMLRSDESRRVIGQGGAGALDVEDLDEQDGKYAITTEALNADPAESEPEIAHHNNIPPYHAVNWMIKT